MPDTLRRVYTIWQLYIFALANYSNVNTDFEIRELNKDEEIPYDLLLIADPSKANVDAYVLQSIIYVADLKGKSIGCYVLHVDNESAEIKNIAVDQKHQGKGIGTILLNDAITKAINLKLKKIIIGTGNSSIGQLHLYQKVGFRITSIIPDFFRKHYDELIMENGIECRDMIVLTKQL